MSPSVQIWLKFAAWLAITAIAIVTVLPIGLRPTTPYSPNTERFFVMAIVGGLFVLAYPARLWAVIFALACGAAVFEPLQFFALGRHPSLRDVVVKSAGAAAGAITGYLLSRVGGLKAKSK
ncbi:MAG: hypothetical protein Q7T45_16250 [Bradyrhizobium sp.]|uniref:hypothetical protein n=1 Tax=Bradyrhizobium sp. TaxID=376 RepID=UPI00271CC4A5|nr:hypothetical protein [Bradyrhizobium sp.]MDO8399364.1 hypothetical protein [Bradyrhizobium sp.]